MDSKELSRLIAWKRYWKRRKEARYARAAEWWATGAPLANKRYLKFIDLFFPKVLYLMAQEKNKPAGRSRRVKNAELIAAAITCLPDAGFREPVFNKDGVTVNGSAIHNVNNMLKNPAIQDILLERFQNIGFTPQDADKKLVSLINSSDEKVATTNLQFYYKLTTPTQVIKTENKNLNVNTQLVTPADSWNSEPPIFLDKD
jgi:hypothetical protein